MTRRVLVAALVGALMSAGQAGAQVTPTIRLAVRGPADWNVDTNWISPEGAFVPGDNFPQEVAVINNAGTAFLNTAALFPVDGLVLDNGTLDLRAGGSLTVENAGGTALGLTRVSGISTLSLTGNAELETGTLTTSGRVIRRITAPTAGVISATEAANLGGALSIAFEGFTPSPGQSWRIVDAPADALSGSFATAQATGLPRGVIMEVDYDRANGDASVSLENRLVLTVDRRTGATSFSNLVGPSITIDGYTISSASGQLSASGWQSLDEQNNPAGWFEANPSAGRLSELKPDPNPAQQLVMTAGSTRAIGNPYDWQPTAFAEAPVEDLEFRYFSPNGDRETGIVEYTGLHNNLVLLVDTATGAAAIQNQSTFAAEIDFYTITSASNSLNPAGWNSLDEQNIDLWAQANPKSDRLSELYSGGTGGSLFSPGEAYEIGNAFRIGGQRDLRFRFTLSDGTPIDGIVEYGPFDISPPQLGDTDDDGDVDITDLNNVRNNFGATGLGDTDGDNDVDITDLNNVRNNFGAQAGAATAPEPSALALVLIGLVAAGCAAMRR